jgi:hypothetical protein
MLTHQTLDQLLNDSNNPNELSLPIYCSAGLPSDVAHFLECGADRVLLKPLDVDAFTEAMREMKDFSTCPQIHVNGAESPIWDRDRMGEREGDRGKVKGSGR